MSGTTEKPGFVDLSIIIPCYNEEENIRHLKEELFEGIGSLLPDDHLELIFVDDGSSDRTWHLLHEYFEKSGPENLSIRFCRHEENRGLGAAIRTGIMASHGQILLTSDSDGTYAYSEIPNLIQMLNEDTAIVSASPYHPQGRVEGVSAYRLILSRGSSFLYRVLVDWRIYTYTSLFRAYRREVFQHLAFSADDYLAGTEILVKALLKGFRIVEYPSLLRVRRLGASKTRILQTIRSHLVFQFKILAYRLGFRSLLRLRGDRPTL